MFALSPFLSNIHRQDLKVQLRGGERRSHGSLSVGWELKLLPQMKEFMSGSSSRMTAYGSVRWRGRLVWLLK